MANAWFIFVLALAAALLVVAYKVAHRIAKRAEERQLSYAAAPRVTPEEVSAAGEHPLAEVIDVNLGEHADTVSSYERESA